MSKHDEKIDELLRAAAGEEWTKIALIISKVFETPDFDTLGLTAQDVAERLYILIDNGQLDVQGKMRRWRDGEVRLVPAKPKKA